MSSSSSLRRQREAALKRRSQNSENDSFISNSVERPQTSSSSHHRNAAMADAFAWEEIKTKERIEQREKAEQVRREEEARMAQKQREEEESRRELQRFEQEQEQLEQELAQKKNEAAQRLEEESRRLADAKAEAEKIEKERLDAEAANKRAELQRMEAELIQERQKVKIEAEQLAGERRRQSAGSTTSGKGEDNNEDAYGQYSEGGNNGYQRYLTSFHQPTEETKDDDGGEGATVISELTDTVNSPTELKSKMQRSTSSRSLSFNKVNEAAQITSINDVNLDDPNDMRTFLMRPCPKGDGMIQCCIRRNKGIKNALFPEYRIYLKSSNGKTETFLMTSKKRGKI